MARAPKFTFKKGEKATGLMRIAKPHPSTEISLAGENVGWIAPPDWRGGKQEWRIWLHLKDEGAGGGFRNAKLKVGFSTEPEARQWLRENQATILAKHAIHGLED